MQRYVRCGNFKCKVETLDLMIAQHLPSSPQMIRQVFREKIEAIYGADQVAPHVAMLGELGVGELLIMLGEIHDERLEG